MPLAIHVQKYGDSGILQLNIRMKPKYCTSGEERTRSPKKFMWQIGTKRIAVDDRARIH